MKIFSWMQNKLNGKQRTRKPTPLPADNHLVPVQQTCKEESSDWPNELLSIGTFGNNTSKDLEKATVQDQEDEILTDEVGEIHKELELLLHKESPLDCMLIDESAKHNLPPEEFFDSPQFSEDDRPNGELLIHVQGSTTAIQSKGNDNNSDKNNGIRKKSLSFLLRKLFLHTGRSKLTPLSRDTIPELKLEKSMMDKILRAMVRKKIHPQGSKAHPKKWLDKIHPQGSKTPPMKCFDKQYGHESDSEDEMLDKTRDGSKWVKTDSEFIVLEM